MNVQTCSVPFRQVPRHDFPPPFKYRPDILDTVWRSRNAALINGVKKEIMEAKRQVDANLTSSEPEKNLLLRQLSGLLA